MSPLPSKPRMRPQAYVVLLFVGVGSVAALNAAPPLTNSMCPVLQDEPVDPEVWTAYEGEAVFFCCNRCKKEFLESPDSFLAALPQFAMTSQAAEDHERAEPRTTDEQRGELASAAPIAREHDHATGHGEPHVAARLVRLLGKFHPVVVHFPIALAIAAFIAEGLFFITLRGLYADAARFAAAAAAITAVVTVTLGWSAGAFAHYSGNLSQVLWFHRWAGTGAGILIVGTAILSELSHRHTKNRALRIAYRCCLLVSTLAVGLAGHLGAILIYGSDHFAW